MLTTVYLSGELAKKWGRRHVLDVQTPAEALRAIEVNQPGLRAYLVQATDRGVDFKVTVGKDPIRTPELVNFASRGRTIRIAPVVRGSKEKWVGIVVGVALVALTWGIGTFAATSMAGKFLATTAFGIKGLTYGALIGGIGVSMAVGGISQALSRPPPMPESPEGTQSAMFGGPVNATAQGLPVPIVYGGPIVVGSVRISAGIKSEDRAGKGMAKTGMGATDGEGSFTQDPEYTDYSGTAATPTNVKGRNLETVQVARLVDLICEGEIAGLCDSAGNLLSYADRHKGIFFDKTQVQNDDGTFAFKDASTAIRYGTQAQDYLPGFPETESTTSVNVEVIKGNDKTGNAVQRTIPAGAYDAVRVDITIPALWAIDSKGNQVGNSVHFGIHIREGAGPWKEVVGSNVLDNGEIDGLIQGTATQPYVRSFRIPLENAGPWDIRVLKESADATDSTKDQSRVFFTSYTTIIDHKLRYPNSVVAGVEVDATKTQSIPETAYRIKGLKVKIPSNYNPTTRNYTGAWDGTFAAAKAWTNNPAWIFYDLLTNARYGLGKYIPEALVDKWALYAIARYCDGVDANGNYVGVDNGNGGTEPRFACNANINNAEEAWKLLQDLASVFRGMIYWSSGQVSLVQDSPKDPTFVFTNANAVDGIFNYSGTAKKARHSVALVQWNDQGDPFNPSGAVEYVEDKDGIARYGIRETRVAAFGCTSRGQAQRLGRWILYTERLETETVTFLSGQEGARCRPGDIIQVRDRYRTTNRMGGRVKSLGGLQQVILDAEITLSGSGDTLTIAQTDGSLVDYPITTPAGATDTVTVTGDLAKVVAGAVWVHSNSAVAVEEWRVLNVREKDKHQFEVIASRFVDTKFASVETGVNTTPPPTSDLPGITPPAAPATVSITKNRVITGPKAELVLDFNWSRSSSKYVVGYRVEIRRPNDQWEVLAPRLNALSLRSIPYTAAGNYSARITTINVAGLESPPALATLSVTLDTTAPGAPSSVAAANVVGGIYVSWSNPSDADFLLGGRIELYESATNSAPSAATPGNLDAGLAEGFTRSGLAAGTTRYYWVRAVDADGNASAWVGPVSGTAEQGPAGATGAAGPGLVSVGDYVSTTVYFHTATRKDVVRHGGNFYLTNNTAKSGLNTWGTPGSSSDWEGPYTSYKFVATSLLLAEDATITKTLVMGDGATQNGGIIRSVGATAFGTGTGYWLNPRNASNLPEFRVGNPSNAYLSFDGSKLLLSAGPSDSQRFTVDIDPDFVGAMPPARLRFGTTFSAKADSEGKASLYLTDGAIHVSHGTKFSIGNFVFGFSLNYGVRTDTGEARFAKFGGTTNFIGTATFNSDNATGAGDAIVINRNWKLHFWNASNGTYIMEDNGLQLWGDGTHPVQIKGTNTDLQLAIAYTAGAPTATGYLVLRDSNGTRYKIPAVAL